MKQTTVRTPSYWIALWLLLGVVMIIIQIVIGGITRLTGSGLSITEWQPILGALPPLNEADWQQAFDAYKEIGQYKQLNFHFTLADFKFIYFWEWFHRLWARLIAVAFAIPFVLFLVKGFFRRMMILPMAVLFLLGGLQGALGWIMVKSGLNEEALFVSHYRLAIHFMAALVLLCYTLWFALKLIVPEGQLAIASGRQKQLVITVIFLLTIQLVFGAFMAGLKAAAAAPTWPDLNGSWWPQWPQDRPFNDPLLIQFIHRSLAYVVAVLTFYWWWQARKINPTKWFRVFHPLPLVLTLLQVLLGIATVLFSADRYALIGLGAAHQFTAILLLLSWVMTFYAVHRSSRANDAGFQQISSK
ncbi:MAG: hypothetical protein RL732_1437 [Bacteroidota bacterium]